MASSSHPRRVFCFGPFELSEREGELRRKNGSCAHLQQQPLRVLVTLLTNSGQVVSRQELRETLWPANSYVDFDVGLNTAIRKLRRLLEDDADNPRYIETFSRRGYRFNESVSVTSRDTEATDARAEARRPIRSIAVLAFANLSGDPNNQYFSDGLAEDLISAFSRLRGLKVSSRSSAFRYRDNPADIRDIGRELNVEAVLEGSVRRSADRLRITVQLVSTIDGYQYWSERFDRDAADVLNIQDEITAAIVKALEPSLAHQQQALSRRNSRNAEAYELYLKGRHLWYQRAEAPMRAGLECFRAATDLDSDYAVAHCGIADSLSILAAHGYMSINEARPRAAGAVTRALSLDGTLTEPHFSAGLAASVFGTLDAAQDHFGRGLEIEPNSSMLHAFLSLALATDHRFNAAIESARRAIECDPRSAFVQGVAALALQCARDHQAAFEAGTRALELQPNFVHGLWSRNMAGCVLGRWEESIAAGEDLVSVSRRSSVFLGQLGMTYALSGRRDKALALRDEVMRRSHDGEYIGPTSLLAINLGLDDLASAKADLQAYIDDGGNGWHLEISMGPFLDRLGEHPLFADLLRRTGRPRSGTPVLSTH